MSLPSAKLSCRQCQQRKTKCDKTTPCSACVRAGYECTAVQRQRLPRGRSGNARSKDTGLRARINRLEAVVAQLQNIVPSSASPVSGEESSPNLANQQVDGTLPTSENASSKPAKTNRYVASDFWTKLTDEVAGLRDVLEDSDEDDNHPHSVSTVNDMAIAASKPDSNSLLFGVSLCNQNPDILQRPHHEVRIRLYDIYRSRVDPICKVLHWPSTQSLLGSEDFHLGDAEQTISYQALENSICFAALCTLLDGEIENRRSLVQHYRLATELSLVRARLLSSRDFLVLQAFVIYLIALRTCQSTAETWTLIACAARIANAQGVDSVATNGRTPFEIEMHKRTWFCIGLLDMQSAHDRGTRTLLAADAFRVMPADINDADMSPASSVPIVTPATDQFTDMSFCLLAYHAMMCDRRLAESDGPSGRGPGEHSSQAIWDKKMGIVKDFEDYVSRVCKSDRASSTFQSFTAKSGPAMLENIRFLLRRPRHRVHFGPRDRDDGYDVLQKATEALEQSCREELESEFAPWSWFAWVRWYALAIVLAELCGRPPGTEWERAWPVAEKCYHSYAGLVADGDTGLLWKPIAKLMRKAQRVRLQGKEGSQVNHSAVPTYSASHEDRDRHGFLNQGMASLEGQQAYPPDQSTQGKGEVYTYSGPEALKPAGPDDYMDLNQDTQWMDPSFGVNQDAMSWFNWEAFINDVNDQGQFY